MEGDKQVTVNVGGSFITTKLSTLNRYPNSRLAHMVLESESMSKDATGPASCLFLDRDPVLFRHILNFLRSGRVLLPDNYQELEMLRQEAVFYELYDFILELPAPPASTPDDQPPPSTQNALPSSHTHNPQPHCRSVPELMYVSGKPVNRNKVFDFVIEAPEAILWEIGHALSDSKIKLKEAKYLQVQNAKRYAMNHSTAITDFTHVIVQLGWELHSTFERSDSDLYERLNRFYKTSQNLDYITATNMEGDRQVTLNVGGSFITTKLSTLTRYPNSQLARMVLESDTTWQSESGDAMGPASCLFLDRDPVLFRHILNFLRGGRVLLPDNYQELGMLRQEAMFYKLYDFITELPAPPASTPDDQPPPSTQNALPSSHTHNPQPHCCSVPELMLVYGKATKWNYYKLVIEAPEAILKEIGHALSDSKMKLETTRYLHNARRYAMKHSIAITNFTNVIVQLGWELHSTFERDPMRRLKRFYVRYPHHA